MDRYITDAWYSKSLFDSLKGKCTVFYYSNRNVWHGVFTPFQIIHRAVTDDIDVIHLQFEIYTFGNAPTHLFLPALFIMSKICRKKVVITVHSVIPKYMFDKKEIEKIIPSGVTKSPKLLKIFVEVTYRIFFKLPSKVIVHSNVFKKWLEEYGLRNIIVIPHGVNSENRYDIPERWVSYGPRMIMCFGVVTPRKGLETLIEAYSIMKSEDVQLLIIGSEMSYYKGYMRSLKELVKGKGLEGKVTFSGFLKDDEVNYLFDKAEIIVLPYRVSISASGSLAFAVQHCKPVIVTETEFFKEELKVTEALFTEKNNSSELAYKMDFLLNNDTLKEYLSNNLRLKRAERGWNKVSNEFMKVYQDLIGN